MTAVTFAADLLDPPVPPWAWEKQARPEQLPPPGDWLIWLVSAGRGWGKSRLGSEWLARNAILQPERHFAVIARSREDVRDTCIEGPSGLLVALGWTRDDSRYNRVFQKLRLDNGSVIHAYGAEQPARLRGPNFAGAWADELASWRYEETWTEGLIPALRIGDPRIVVTTTPRRTRLLRSLLNRQDGTVHVTRGSTFDNAQNLSPSALAELRRRYEGTRLGRQELWGEMLEDVQGALWNAGMFDDRAGWENGEPPAPGQVRRGS